MTKPKSDYQNQTRVPKTDIIATAIQSPAWASAVARTLMETNSSRRLEAFLSIDDLQQKAFNSNRQITIVEVNDRNFKRCCQLAMESSECCRHFLLIGLTTGLVGKHRHALQVSGFGVTFGSFADLLRIANVVDKFFASLPVVEMTVEQSVELGLPWQ